MSLKKEPQIYSENWQTENQDKFWLTKHAAKLKGEATVGYFINPQVPRRIYETNPYTKLIFCLRNPIERTYSHYWHGVKNGYEKRSWKEALRSRTRQDQYLFEFSFYYQNITRFLDFFPLTQIHFFLLEGYRQSHKKEIDAVLDFLGLEAHGPVLDSKYVNRGKSFKNNKVHYLLERVRKNHQYIPNFISKPGRYFYDLAIKLNTGNVNAEQLKGSDRNILKELYRFDVKNLGTLIKNLDQHWKDFK